MNNKSKPISLPYTLRDCKHQNRIHPELFFVPKAIDIEALTTGSIVKLIFTNTHTNESERMWVTITEIHNNGYTGLLSNVPEIIDGLKLQDTIHFKKVHIANIYHK